MVAVQLQKAVTALLAPLGMLFHAQLHQDKVEPDEMNSIKGVNIDLKGLQ